MRKILITGGPVHAHIDDVKIVTNRFKGGLMAALAEDLAAKSGSHVVYLTAPGAASPAPRENIEVVRHAGFWDYSQKVMELGARSTDVVLGAAVANLIPKTPIVGKFPSHDYQEGETVSLDFVITPRVITKIKPAFPALNLFGFKLLSGASHEELMRAAWKTLEESKAAAVVANDASDLLKKYVLTKEGAVHEMGHGGVGDFLWKMMGDEFYATIKVESSRSEVDGQAREELEVLLESWRTKEPGMFPQMPGGLVFGSAAVKCGNGFWTTGRGKRELLERAKVESVDHAARKVAVSEGKASLNAPLMAAVFEALPLARSIIHGHVQRQGLPTLDWAQPGTVADSRREVRGSFNIDKHGCFIVLDGQGRQMDWS